MSRSQPKAAPRPRRRKGRRQRKAVASALPVVRPQVAGIDLGSREHWACGPPREEGEQPNVKVFESTTPELARLCAWLEGQGVESVAMESTHVYWIPLYEMLESRGIEVLLVNARHLKSVPGRKTDMLDCQWLQKLHSCGLLRGSFRPNESITRLRAIHRQLENLVQQRSRIVHWMQQALDQMNVQVHRAVTDLTGKTGMAIVRAIVAGERDPLRLAALRDGRCKKTPEQFAAHLTGTWRAEHLFNLERSLSLYDTHQEEIAAYERRLEEELAELACEELREREPPEHPSLSKEKALRARAASSRCAPRCTAPRRSI